MTSVRTERLDALSGAHDVRVLTWTRELADDALAGRTVWCAAASPVGSELAATLRGRLRDDGVAVRALERAAQELIGAAVAADDVVVLHDARSAVLAQVVRDRGAHAVWHVHVRGGTRPAAVRELHALLRAGAPADAVDAYVVTSTQSLGRGRRVERVAALLPSADLVDVKELADAERAGSALGWSSALADVIEVDHEDHVGGTLHARPTVPSR
ncbi:MAG: hypothetical protein JWQ48_2676 [Conexibacter sp.]|jgi:hypothetical protein|nr:hypothetical protein [Conexibacter sp.]